jgi:hypothetical protein
MACDESREPATEKSEAARKLSGEHRGHAMEPDQIGGF